MYKYGFLFLIMALTKLWISIIFTKNYMLKVLDVEGIIEGGVIDYLDNYLIVIIIVEFLISIVCFCAYFIKKGKTQ